MHEHGICEVRTVFLLTLQPREELGPAPLCGLDLRDRCRHDEIAKPRTQVRALEHVEAFS
jgi:hypothetical protein